MSSSEPRAPWHPSAPSPSLCRVCVHVRELESARGSRFLLCKLAARDVRLPKYPPQPRLRCPGFEPAPGRAEPRGG